MNDVGQNGIEHSNDSAFVSLLSQQGIGILIQSKVDMLQIQIADKDKQLERQLSGKDKYFKRQLSGKDKQLKRQLAGKDKQLKRQLSDKNTRIQSKDEMIETQKKLIEIKEKELLSVQVLVTYQGVIEFLAQSYLEPIVKCNRE